MESEAALIGADAVVYMPGIVYTSYGLGSGVGVTGYKHMFCAIRFLEDR